MIIEELKAEGLDLGVISEELGKDLDPFDLICHVAFDAKPYVTVTPDLNFEVSRRIKEEFENGRHYYALQVPNGLPLSKIHHAAFDAHLIGIDPDYRLHVSDRLSALLDEVPEVRLGLG